jgi:hypothetical protein
LRNATDLAPKFIEAHWTVTEQDNYENAPFVAYSRQDRSDAATSIGRRPVTMDQKCALLRSH